MVTCATRGSGNGAWIIPDLSSHFGGLSGEDGGRAVRELSEEGCLPDSVRGQVELRSDGVVHGGGDGLLRNSPATKARVSLSFLHRAGLHRAGLHRAGHPRLRGPASVGRDVAKVAPSSDKDSLRPARAEENQSESVSDKSFQSLFLAIFLREALVFCVLFFGKGTQTFKGGRPIPLVLRKPRAQCGGERI